MSKPLNFKGPIQLSVPSSWGYIFWPVLHWMVFENDISYGADSEADAVDDGSCTIEIEGDWDYCIDNFCDVLPCPGCQVHCHQNQREHEGRKDFEWSVNFHNSVNARNNKSAFSVEDSMKQMSDPDYINQIHREYIPLFLYVISLQMTVRPPSDRPKQIEYIQKFLDNFQDEDTVVEDPPDFDTDDNMAHFKWVARSLGQDVQIAFDLVNERFNFEEIRKLDRADKMRQEDEARMDVMRKALESGGIEIEKVTLAANLEVAERKVKELTSKVESNEKHAKYLVELLKEKDEKLKTMTGETQDSKDHATDHTYLWATMASVCVLLLMFLFLRRF